MSSFVALAARSVGGKAIYRLFCMAARAATQSEVLREQRRVADALVVMGA